MKSKTIATMKNIFKSLMFVAVVAMTFTACQKENNEVNAVSKGTTLTVIAGLADNDTRVAFGELEEGIRKTLWEAGDRVTFVAYRNDQIFTYVNDLEVEADGEVANFTVNFPADLQNGDRIEALVGQYIYSYYDSWAGTTYYYTYTHEYHQNPTDAGLSTVYVQAVANYEGNDNISLTFNHMYPYGKMTTDYAVKFTQVDFEFVGKAENGSDDSAYATIYPDNITGNTYWFYCTNELYDITKIDVAAKDSYGTEYTFTKDIDVAKGFKFENGAISAFAVNDFLSVIQRPSVVVASKTMDSITLDWDDVDHATGYDVVIKNNNGEEVAKESVTVSEYVATGLEAETEYSVDVVATTTEPGFANSDKSSMWYEPTRVKTAIDLTKYDFTSFTDGVTFAKMTKVTGRSNTYLFTTEGGGTTQSDNFMYLSFNRDITTQDGVYDVSDLNYDYCYCWYAAKPNAWNSGNGYTDNYNLGFKPYHVFPNSGDTYVVIVDVDEENPGKLTLTAYLNNASWWSSLKFKGSFTGTVTE